MNIKYFLSIIILMLFCISCDEGGMCAPGNVTDMKKFKLQYKTELEQICSDPATPCPADSSD